MMLSCPMLLVDRQALSEHTTTSSSTKSLGQALRVSLVKPGAYLSKSYQSPRLPLPLIPLVDTKFRENGSQPPPNRACTFQHTRLSILEFLLSIGEFSSMEEVMTFDAEDDCFPLSRNHDPFPTLLFDVFELL